MRKKPRQSSKELNDKLFDSADNAKRLCERAECRSMGNIGNYQLCADHHRRISAGHRRDRRPDAGRPRQLPAADQKLQPADQRRSAMQFNSVVMALAGAERILHCWMKALRQRGRHHPGPCQLRGDDSWSSAGRRPPVCGRGNAWMPTAPSRYTELEGDT